MRNDNTARNRRLDSDTITTVSPHTMATMICPFASSYILVFHIISLMWLPMTQSSLEWHLINNGTGTPGIIGRRDAAIGYDGVRDRLVVFGGRTMIRQTERILGDTVVYNIETRRWLVVPALQSPAPRHSMVYGTSGNYLYIATGQGRNNIYYGDIWRFSLSSEEWEQLPAQTRPAYYSPDQWAASDISSLAPDPRFSAAGGIFPNATHFYVSLGYSDVTRDDTLSYHMTERSWFVESKDGGPYHPYYPHSRRLHAGTMISADQLLIFGGCLSGGGSGGACPASDSWVYSAQTRRWTQLGSCASPRTYAGMAMLPITGGERRIILYGGKETGPSKQVLTTIASPREQVGVLNPDTGKWVLRETMGDIPPKRASVSMVTGKNGIYVFGGYEIETGSHSSALYLLLGRSDSADLAPLQAECNPTFFNLIILHGVVMTLAWGFFLPWGAFIARYVRHNDPLWFNLHKLFQIFGLILAIGGFVCAVLSVQDGHFLFVHAIVGLAATVIAVLQPINAALRPHAPALEKKSMRRFLWELIHTFLGRSAVGLGLANISMGVFLAHSHTVIWSVWFAYLGFMLLTYFLAEISYYRRQLNRPSKSDIDGDDSDDINSVANHHGDQYVVKKIIPAKNMPPNILDNFRDDTDL